MILPPRVVVVLSHASTLNVCGPAAAEPAVTAGTASEPVNVTAPFASPLIAPATLRVAPVEGVRSATFDQSYAVPLASPSRQWSAAPSALTRSRYLVLVAVPAGTV